LQTIIERLWATSPASLTKALRRRVHDLNVKPGWFKVKAGPLVGAELLLPSSTEGAWGEMVEGTFDAFLYEALKSGHGPEGLVCWDIGAHFGYHSLALAALGGEVVAFEPNQYNAERLQANLERNPKLAKHVRHLPLAVSDRDGEVTFVESGDLKGKSSGSHLAEATPPLEGKHYQDFTRRKVRAVRMDSLIAEGEKAPDVVKIDIEGAEYLALQGGRKLLSEKKPLLLVEVHHICLMFYIQRFLLELGYETKLLDESGAIPSRCFLMATGRHTV
jgi:FkbM family methyltransferase